jgi:hypothetical protein
LNLTLRIVFRADAYITIIKVAGMPNGDAVQRGLVSAGQVSPLKSP